MCNHSYETIGFEFEDGLYYWRNYHKDLFNDIFEDLEFIIPETNELVMNTKKNHLTKEKHFKISTDIVALTGQDLEIKSNSPLTFYNEEKKAITKLSDINNVLKDYVLFYKNNMYLVLKRIEGIKEWNNWKEKEQYLPIGFEKIKKTNKVCMLYSLNPLNASLDNNKSFSKTHNFISCIAPQATISMDIQKVWRFFNSPFPFFKEYQIDAIAEVINVKDVFDKMKSVNNLSVTFWGFITYLNLYLSDKNNKKMKFDSFDLKSNHSLFLRHRWKDYWKDVLALESMKQSTEEVIKAAKDVISALWKDDEKAGFKNYVISVINGKKHLSTIFERDYKDITPMDKIYMKGLKGQRYIFIEIRNMRTLLKRHYNVTECMVIVTCLFDWLSRFHKAKIKPLKTLTYKKIKKVRAEIKKQLKNDWVEKDDLEELLKNLAPKKKKEE